MGLLLGSLVDVFAFPVASPGATTAALVLAALAAATALLLAVASQIVRTPGVSSSVPSGTRQRSERTIYLRLRDPNAAGRPHPRAPSVQPTAG
jgi:Family of unknown function (DUF6412)